EISDRHVGDEAGVPDALVGELDGASRRRWRRIAGARRAARRRRAPRRVAGGAAAIAGRRAVRAGAAAFAALAGRRRREIVEDVTRDVLRALPGAGARIAERHVRVDV